MQAAQVFIKRTVGAHCMARCALPRALRDAAHGRGGWFFSPARFLTWKLPPVRRSTGWLDLCIAQRRSPSECGFNPRNSIARQVMLRGCNSRASITAEGRVAMRSLERSGAYRAWSETPLNLKPRSIPWQVLIPLTTAIFASASMTSRGGSKRASRSRCLTPATGNPGIQARLRSKARYAGRDTSIQLGPNAN